MPSLGQKINLLAWMTRCDFKLRDQGTALGFLWTLLNPLLLFAVLYMVFNAWFGKLVEHYAIYLFIGIIHWNFFSLATSNAVTIFERKRHLLKSFPISPIMIPVTAVLTVFTSYVLESCIAIILCSFAIHISLSTVFCFFILLPVHLILVLSISILLANAFVFFRDVSHLWGIALRIGFFITPIFYPLNFIEGYKLVILKLNPLYHIFDFSRQAILQGSIELNWSLFYLLGFTLITALVSIKVYLSSQEYIVERL